MQHSSLILFARDVKGKRLSASAIRSGFVRRVDKEDWKGSSKDEILKYLEKLSNRVA